MEYQDIRTVGMLFEGVRGFYKGITPNLLKNVPISSIAYIVYGKVLKLLKSARGKD
ncbi:folate transporter/carrier-like protein [Medicago truncatula]|uniref:Folate transporter/carrier-like protein n=1 Tax=Medicago truncatula TaxID=3880 RepID=A0A072U3M2_MEDTR|nr:folate transporter/carrier-like protein [Medicago truncatula]